MLSPSRRRSAVLLVLLVLSFLTTSGVWAAGSAALNERPSKTATPASASLFGRAWNLVAAFWAKSVCHIDPNGLCVFYPDPAPSVTTQGDTGCAVDPNGRCGS